MIGDAYPPEKLLADIERDGEGQRGGEKLGRGGEEGDAQRQAGPDQCDLDGEGVGKARTRRGLIMVSRRRPDSELSRAGAATPHESPRYEAEGSER